MCPCISPLIRMEDYANPWGFFLIYFLNHEATQVFICNTEHYVEI